MPSVCVVGLGKLGLPVAVHIAGLAGIQVQVRGADIDKRVVELVNSGVEPFPGEPELQERLAAAHALNRLSATTDTTEAVAASDAVIVLVPLVVDTERRPVFDALDAATDAIASGLRPGTLVSYETTLPVGTTRGRFATRLAERSGLSVGQDLFVVHSPERVFTGRVFSDLRRYPKLVGGVTGRCRDRGVAFYEQVLEFDDRSDLDTPNGVWPLATVETAEMAKLAETTYRNVNIGLANEFALFAERHSIDVYDVISAANSQPFSHIHQPGVSVGGHCIPVYPHLYTLNDDQAVLPRASVAVNEAMPKHHAELLAKAMGGSLGGRTVVVLGLSYRGAVKESAFSGTGPLVAALGANGATAVVHDPMFTPDEVRAEGFEPYKIGQPADGVILHTAHDTYRDLGSSDIPGVVAVVDGRNFLDRERWPETRFVSFGRAG